jgi:hypothetical protein
LSKKRKIIYPSKKTPEVILDPKGFIRMTGRLIPENADEFFNPIEDWINEYFCDPAEITHIDISFEYINSTGTKYLFYIVHKIINIRLLNDTSRFKINWYYKNDDEDILEKGKLFAMNLNVPINFIEIP